MINDIFILFAIKVDSALLVSPKTSNASGLSFNNTSSVLLIISPIDFPSEAVFIERK